MGQNGSSSYVVEIAPSEQQAHKPAYDGTVPQHKEQLSQVRDINQRRPQKRQPAPNRQRPLATTMHVPRGWQKLATVGHTYCKQVTRESLELPDRREMERLSGG